MQVSGGGVVRQMEPEQVRNNQAAACTGRTCGPRPHRYMPPVRLCAAFHNARQQRYGRPEWRAAGSGIAAFAQLASGMRCSNQPVRGAAMARRQEKRSCR